MEGAIFETDQVLWRVLLQMQKDQRDFYKFSKAKFKWQKKINDWSYEEEMAVPVFLDHILGELEEEEIRRRLRMMKGRRVRKIRIQLKIRQWILGSVQHHLLVCPKMAAKKNPRRRLGRKKSLIK